MTSSPAWFRSVEGYQFRGVRHAWHFGPVISGRRVAVCGVELTEFDMRPSLWCGRLCRVCVNAEHVLGPWLLPSEVEP